MTFDEKQQLEETPGNGPKRAIFGTVFSGGRVEIGAPVDPIEFSQRKTNIKFSLLKKLLLMVIICALALTVLLIIKQITVREKTQSSKEAVQSTDSGRHLSSSADQLLSNITSDEEPKERVIQTAAATASTTIRVSTTTTVGTTRTEGTTTTTTAPPKILDHLLATIVINNATVPNKDGYVSLTDTYVKAFVDEIFIGQTPVQKETLTPEWNYQIAHDMTLRPDSVLKFMLYDNDKYSSHEFLGQIEVRTSLLMTMGYNAEPFYMNHGSGVIWITVTWQGVYRNY